MEKHSKFFLGISVRGEKRKKEKKNQPVRTEFPLKIKVRCDHQFKTTALSTTQEFKWSQLQSERKRACSNSGSKVKNAHGVRISKEIWGSTALI